jgi:hypothetical protein
MSNNHDDVISHIEFKYNMATGRATVQGQYIGPDRTVVYVSESGPIARMKKAFEYYRTEEVEHTSIVRE